MHLLLIILITFYYANAILSVRISRQIKEDFLNTFNNFLQSDFRTVNSIPYPRGQGKINIVYKTVEEPVHVEKTIPVPFVKHVPQPLPVYVPQPYPVEKKIFVPYKVYEKQPVPIIHRYPVEKSVRIPVHVPIEQPVAILVPYSVPVGKRVSFQTPVHSRSYVGLRQIPVTTPEHDRVLYPRDKMKFEADNPISVPEEVENLMKNSIPSPKPSPSSYTTKTIISYGTRLPVPTTDIEKQESRSGKESVQHSEQVQIITPAPVVEKCEASTTPIIDSTGRIDTKNEETETEVDESKEGTGIIVFPTEQSYVELKS